MKKNLIMLRSCLFKMWSGKIFRIMKLTNLLLLVAVFNVFGNATFYGQTLNLDMKDTQIKEVLSAIESQSDFFFLYSSKMIDVTSKVDVLADNKNVTEVLNTLFKGTDIAYDIKDKQILLSNKELAASTVMAIQQRTITGKVISVEDNLGMPGVPVVVKGTTVGTATDIDGNFTLNVPNGAIIVVSFMGYRTIELPVGNQTQFNITLEPDAIALGDVVVTALGISRERKTLTYSVSEVGGESIAQAKELNLGNALTGRIAGVNASGSATGPMGSTRVIIRGNTSLGGDNQPLYVVNGVPIIVSNLGSAGSGGGRDSGDGLASINPDDIENISVLKGGTAAALYGSRAANGVILITTKSGTVKQGIGIEYNSSFTFENVLTVPDWQYEYGSGFSGVAPPNQTAAIDFGRISWGAKLDGSMVYNPDGEQRPYVAQKNNNKNFYDTGTTFSNTVAISSGNETVSFRFSASNTDANSVVPNSSMNRKTFNLNTNANLSKKIVFEGRAQYNVELAKNRTSIADFTANPNAAVGLLATNIDVRTLKPGWDENGNEMQWCEYNFVSNPYFAAYKRINEDERQRFLGSFSLRYNIFDFLWVRARLGTDYSTIESLNITPTGTAHESRGTMSEGTRKFFENNAEILIGFDKTFGDISVNALAGGNQRYYVNRNNSFSSGRFDVPFYYFLTNGTAQTASRSFSESATNSLYASADIGYKNFLFLTVSGRQDWFSTLTDPYSDSNQNYIFYPSAGLSYIITETWQSRPAWLSFAKARASWAQVGGGAPSAYGTTLEYAASNVQHLGQPIMSISSSTIPNILKPYTSTTMEAGIDFRLFNNRIGVDITVYDRTTKNDIVSASLPVSSAWSSISLNVGKVQNRGVELMLTGTPITSRTGLNWDVIFNMAYNKNEVVEISEGIDHMSLTGVRTGNAWVDHWVGQPFGMVSGYEMRRNESGQIVYNNVNGFPMQSDLKALGRGVPPLNISLTNEFSYKNFSLSFFLDSKWGGVMYSAANAYGTFYGLHKNTVANGVRETGVTVNGVDQNGNSFNRVVGTQEYYRDIAFRITDQYVYKADFIKLRQINFGYSVPRAFLSKTPFQSANFSFVARNLFLIYSPMENVDPESNYNTGNGQGLENFGVPPTRNYGFSLSVRF